MARTDKINVLNNKKLKIIRATTVPVTLDVFCNGTLRELSFKYEVIALSSPGKEMSQLVKREGVRSIEIPMCRHISLMRDVVSLWKVVRAFCRERPQMVHSMTPKAGLLCMIAAWWTKVPVRVHTFTGLVWPTETGFKRKLLMLTDKITCACATHIIPEGEGVKKDLLENGITKKPIKVLGYGNVRGVDMIRFSRRSEVMEKVQAILDKEKFTFVFVGRIVRDKGVNELCEAFDRLNKQYPNTRLFLVGMFEDDLDPISEKSKSVIETNASIQAVGVKHNDDLLAYYAASDCFVFPSYREGFPNTVLEAGAMGLPSIVTDINGSREIIIEDENGTIIPSKNVEALYKAMERMVVDEGWRKTMAGNARQLIQDRFERGFVQQQLINFYEEILA
ncbi:MAG: glycosyltransferase family 4 protein [Prevotella sp.]|nr:glycosyltransferase family 4 protein [Prevotella sp.]